MKLAVTDLGFDGIESVAHKLYQNGIEYVEVIPTKIKPYHALNVKDMLMYKDILAEYKLKPYSFLSLVKTRIIECNAMIEILSVSVRRRESNLETSKT